LPRRRPHVVVRRPLQRLPAPLRPPVRQRDQDRGRVIAEDEAQPPVGAPPVEGLRHGPVSTLGTATPPDEHPPPPARVLTRLNGHAASAKSLPPHPSHFAKVGREVTVLLLPSRGGKRPSGTWSSFPATAGVVRLGPQCCSGSRGRPAA